MRQFKKKAEATNEITPEERDKLLIQVNEKRDLLAFYKSSGKEAYKISEVENQILQLEQKLIGQGKNKYNATKFLYNGFTYDSKREADFAKELDRLGIPYEKQFKFILQDAFDIENEHIRSITLTVDFIIDNIVVDVKGMITEEFNIKWKLLKYKFGNEYVYRTVINSTQQQQVMLEIKKNKIEGINLTYAAPEI